MLQKKFKNRVNEVNQKIGVNKFVNNNRTLNLIPSIFLALLTALVVCLVYIWIFR